MRVLHLIDSLIQAGAEALVKDMVPRMRTRGVDVCVAVLKELDSPFERELREKGISFLPTVPGGFYNPGHLLSLRRYIPDFDVVHVYLFPAQLFAPIATILAGSKVPLVLSEGTPHHRRRRKWLYPLEKWMYSRYTAVACASDAIAASLREWIPSIGSKITVIGNGIDVQKFQHAKPVSRASAGISNSSCVLLMWQACSRAKTTLTCSAQWCTYRMPTSCWSVTANCVHNLSVWPRPWGSRDGFTSSAAARMSRNC